MRGWRRGVARWGCGGVGKGEDVLVGGDSLWRRIELHGGGGVDTSVSE